MWVRRERGEASSGRDAASWGTATTVRDRDEAWVEKDVAHAEAREAMDAARKDGFIFLDDPFSIMHKHAYHLQYT